MRMYGRRYYHKNKVRLAELRKTEEFKEKRNIYLKGYRLRNKEKRRQISKQYNARLRYETLMNYSDVSPKCACCGEDTYEFLSLDHIYGGGNQHRKVTKTVGSGIYRWLRKNGYPKGFQVLCHNCNQAKGIYGQCPHKQKKEVIIYGRSRN